MWDCPVLCWQEYSSMAHLMWGSLDPHEIDGSQSRLLLWGLSVLVRLLQVDVRKQHARQLARGLIVVEEDGQQMMFRGSEPSYLVSQHLGWMARHPFSKMQCKLYQVLMPFYVPCCIQKQSLFCQLCVSSFIHTRLFPVSNSAWVVQTQRHWGLDKYELHELGNK